MKYLLAADWKELVRRAERYEALVALISDQERRGAAIETIEKKTRADVDVMCDSEVERQGEASRRASGDSDCKTCGKPYRKHPRGGPIGWGEEQFLNRLCDGRLVKL